VIIAVTCAVITAMVITGVIVGVKFSLDSTAEIVKVIDRFRLHRITICIIIDCVYYVFHTRIFVVSSQLRDHCSDINKLLPCAHCSHAL